VVRIDHEAAIFKYEGAGKYILNKFLHCPDLRRDGISLSGTREYIPVNSDKTSLFYTALKSRLPTLLPARRYREITPGISE
jgi:hypothetical protein